MKDPTNFVKADELYRHRSQRAMNGFSWYDWINFDTYLSWVIVSGLEKFKEEGHGYPMGLTEEEWAETLDKMIAGFRAHLEMADVLAHSKAGMTWQEFRDSRTPLWEEGSRLFIEYYGSLWD